MFKNFIKLLLALNIAFLFNFVAVAKETDGISVFKLKNGQTVVIKEVHSNPIVTIDTWVDTGTKNENDCNNGVSHFLEHLLFKGTNKYKVGDADKILESKGATFNAATSKDFTHFYTTIDKNYFDLALDIQADMLGNAQIPVPELDRERKVVQEEIVRSEDDNGSKIFKNLNKSLFKVHPYEYETLGSAKNIGEISREEIFKYYRTWYVPSNMTTVIVGDVDTRTALKKVEEDFNFCTNVKPTALNFKREPSLTKKVEIVEKGDYSSGYMEMGFKGVPIFDKKENYSLDLAALILGQGRSSRLYQSLKENKELVSSISAGHFSLRDDSIFYVSADFKAKNYDKVKKAVLEEIQKFKTVPISDAELKRAKTKLQREFIYSNESVEDVANSIGYTMVLTHDLSYYTDYINEINKITKEDIQKTFIKYVDENKMAVSALLPDKLEVSDVKPLTEANNDVKKTVLPNGITLISEKNDANDIVSASVIFKGGSFLEPKAGMNSLLAYTLTKGTKTRDALQLSTELEDLGISISPLSESDYFEIGIKSTLKDFDKAYEVLVDILNNSVFPEKYIENSKKDILESIKQSRDEPDSLAFLEFTQEIYKNHPYGKIGSVIESQLPKVTREDLLAYYKKILIPENMIFSVSGKINHEELVDKLTKSFDRTGIKPFEKEKFLTKYEPLLKNELITTSKKTSSAQMLMGWKVRGVLSEKDYATLKVISSILGNGMSSRLFVDMREKQGLAYSVSAIYPSRLDNSFFVLYIGTKPENVVKVKNDFLYQINRFKTEKVCDKELLDTKQKILGQYSMSQETNQQRAHYLAWFESIGKGYKFKDKYPDVINSVTSDDIIEVAKKYFNNSYLLTVVAPEESIKRLKEEKQ